MDHYQMTEAQQHMNAIFVMVMLLGSISMSLVMLVLCIFPIIADLEEMERKEQAVMRDTK